MSPVSAAQLQLMPSWAWLVRPSTTRSAFGTPADVATVPASSRCVGPYKARLTGDSSVRTGSEGVSGVSAPAGTLIVASTVAAPGKVTSIVVASSSSGRATGQVVPVSGVRTHYDRKGIHHLTFTLGRSE